MWTVLLLDHYSMAKSVQLVLLISISTQLLKYARAVLRLRYTTIIPKLANVPTTTSGMIENVFLASSLSTSISLPKLVSHVLQVLSMIWYSKNASTALRKIRTSMEKSASNVQPTTTMIPSPTTARPVSATNCMMSLLIAVFVLPLSPTGTTKSALPALLPSTLTTIPNCAKSVQQVRSTTRLPKFVKQSDYS